MGGECGKGRGKGGRGREGRRWRESVGKRDGRGGGREGGRGGGTGGVRDGFGGGGKCKGRVWGEGEKEGRIGRV